ncbi:VOC family protein [Streptomyces sp. YKOK-I1]
MTIGIAELGYVVVGASDVDAWRVLAQDVLGMMAVDGPDSTLRLKMDQRAARIVIEPADEGRFAAAGWVTTSEADFGAARKRLEAGGIEVVQGTSAQLAAREVLDMFSFRDPSGAVHEISCGPIVDSTRFVSPTGVSRFVTDDDGLGHVVLPTGDRLAETVSFWSEVGGFRTANSRTIASPGGAAGKARFLSCNGRQHSLALAGVAMPAGCLHIGIEVGSLDDVGFALDRAHAHGVLVRGLGKHVNDAMVSFYVTTPSGFQIEYGFSDGAPEWSTSVFFEDPLGSHWGHRWVEGAGPVGRKD